MNVQPPAPAEPVTICIAYPLATQSQGDEGNADVLAHRVRLRGGSASVVVHHGPGGLPAADIYVVGGMDESGVAALARLLDTGGLPTRVAAGAGLLAVNAGFQAIGTWFEGSAGSRLPGLGLVEVSFTRGPLVEGPAVVAPEVGLGVPEIGGYESHAARAEDTPRGAGLGTHTLARPDAPAGRPEGIVRGAVLGTFLHGPILARNPALADLLLARATGHAWEPATAGWGDRVRRQRIAEDRADPSGWAGTRYARTLPSLRRLRRRPGAKAGP